MSNTLCDEAREKGATDEQIARILELDTYLEHTDYTVIKVYEIAISDPTTAEELKRQYADVFAERNRCRTEIDQIFKSLEGTQ